MQVGPLIPAALVVDTPGEADGDHVRGSTRQALQPVTSALRQSAAFVQEYTA